MKASIARMSSSVKSLSRWKSTFTSFSSKKYEAGMLSARAIFATTFIVGVFCLEEAGRHMMKKYPCVLQGLFG